MVTGGYDGSNRLDSTEILKDRNNVWTTVAKKLPYPMHSIKAQTLNNRVLLFGMLNIFVIEIFA